MLKTDRHALILLALAPLALLANACMHASSKPKALAAGAEIRVEGQLTQAEFGCLGVRTADGRRFNIARDLEGSRPGQYVWIEGYVVKTKGCMPGTTLMPRQAGLLQGTEMAQTNQVTGR